MEKKKLPLTEEVVKYVFSGVGAEVAPGEDGYIVYGFKWQYPSKLGLFVPIELNRSNFSDVFPKGFESYFCNLDEDFLFLSRLLEIKIVNPLSELGIEYVPGAMLKRDDGSYAIFRFDELVEPDLKTDLLCRIRLKQKDDEATETKILDFKPSFMSKATTLSSVKYLYFIISVGKLFKNSSGMIAAVFAFSQSLHRN